MNTLDIVNEGSTAMVVESVQLDASLTTTEKLLAPNEHFVLRRFRFRWSETGYSIAVRKGADRFVFDDCGYVDKFGEYYVGHFQEFPPALLCRRL